MATPRYKLIDQTDPCDYHLVCRCVRRSWLCGWDTLTLRDYSHRRRWLIRRIKQLAQSFGVEVYAYAVMSNHYHLVLHYDPRAREGWSNEEVARRWLAVYPPRVPAEQVEERVNELCELWVGDEERIQRMRETLGSLSRFMQHLNQPIARQANIEDGCTGHFFEHRFYSGALLSAEAVLAAMAYVDLNPVRAKIVDSLEACSDASIAERLRENNATALQEYLRPVASGLSSWRPSPPQLHAGVSTSSDSEPATGRVLLPERTVEETATVSGGDPADRPETDFPADTKAAATADPSPPPDAGAAVAAGQARPTAEGPYRNSTPDPTKTAQQRRRSEPLPWMRRAQRGQPRRDLGTLASYVELLRQMVATEIDGGRVPADKVAAWLARVTALGKRQRAYGAPAELRRWAKVNGFAPREAPLPA